MSNFEINQVINKTYKDKKGRERETLYFMGKLCFAKVQAPQYNPESKKDEFSVQVFVTEEVSNKLLDEVRVNKEIKAVGIDKNKKRAIKYPLSNQTDKKHHYDDFKGLHGVQLSLDASYEFINSDGVKQVVKNKIQVLDSENNNIDSLVGNGSVGIVQCDGYRNKDGLLNLQFKALKVMELVHYEGSGNDGLVEDEVFGTYKKVYDDTNSQTAGTQEEEQQQDNGQAAGFDDDIPF